MNGIRGFSCICKAGFSGSSCEEALPTTHPTTHPTSHPASHPTSHPASHPASTRESTTNGTVDATSATGTLPTANQTIGEFFKPGKNVFVSVCGTVLLSFVPRVFSVQNGDAEKSLPNSRSRDLKITQSRARRHSVSLKIFSICQGLLLAAILNAEKSLGTNHSTVPLYLAHAAIMFPPPPPPPKKKKEHYLDQLSSTSTSKKVIICHKRARITRD